MQRRCSPAFAFCRKRMRLSSLRARGLERGASLKADEGRRGIGTFKAEVSAAV